MPRAWRVACMDLLRVELRSTKSSCTTDGTVLGRRYRAPVQRTVSTADDSEDCMARVRPTATHCANGIPYRTFVMWYQTHCVFTSLPSHGHASKHNPAVHVRLNFTILSYRILLCMFISRSNSTGFVLELCVIRRPHAISEGVAAFIALPVIDTMLYLVSMLGVLWCSSDPRDVEPGGPLLCSYNSRVQGDFPTIF